MNKRDLENLFYKIAGGSRYDRLVRWAGLSPTFYQRIVGLLPLQPGNTILELGCGTGSLILAIARSTGGGGRFVGIDQNNRQIAHARQKARDADLPILFQRGSAETLPLADASFDLVCASMVFHEMPARARRRSLAEVARVLRPGGCFALIDWTTPRFALHTVLFLPWLLIAGEYTQDHWFNHFPELCSACGLNPGPATYLDSLISCQLFTRKYA